ncbi:MAG TPA: SPOR domain-containing protein, partial [Longimicrobiales bacterium]|nr:SPOR domain-containing protein [Longimicrobiales bacterium]
TADTAKTERGRGPADAAGPRANARPKGMKRYHRPLLWTIGVVLLVSLLAGAWHYLSGRLGSLPSAAAPQPEQPAPPSAAPIEQNALPFVVAIEAHRELPLALNRVADLSAIEPELLFHVEPLERDGTLFYHVMAGPVPDSAAALALRDTLIARGHKTAATPTDVRATPLAFLIGDYSTAAAAQEQREIMRRLDIPAYVLAGTAVDGAPLYRLYVGGFRSDAEADVTRQMLRSAGIRDSLVTRTGSAASVLPIGTEGDSVTAGDSLATPTGSSIP